MSLLPPKPELPLKTLLMEIRERCSSRLRLNKRSPATKKVARKCNAVERFKKEANVVEDNLHPGLQEQQVLISCAFRFALRALSSSPTKPM